ECETPRPDMFLLGRRDPKSCRRRSGDDTAQIPHFLAAIWSGERLLATQFRKEFGLSSRSLLSRSVSILLALSDTPQVRRNSGVGGAVIDESSFYGTDACAHNSGLFLSRAFAKDVRGDGDLVCGEPHHPDSACGLLSGVPQSLRRPSRLAEPVRVGLAL